MYYTRKVLRLLIVTIVFFGCNLQKSDVDSLKNGTIKSESNLPENIKKLTKLSVYSLKSQVYDTVELVKQQVFGSNEEIYIRGHTGEVAVDNKNRVYIEGQKPGEAAIYVFESDGSFKTTIGEYGKGPGEFLVIGEMKIRDDKLYVYDNFQQRVSIFSINDYDLLHDVKIKHQKLFNDNDLKSYRPVSEFFVLNNGILLMKFESNTPPNRNRRIFFYKVAKDGEVLADRILELKKYLYYKPDSFQTAEGLRLSLVMPFSRSSLIDVAHDGSIYTAWTENFLIKIYNPEGKYQRAIYYPYLQSSLSISETDLGESRRQLIEENPDKVPNTWPSLHNMITDDSGRLWIFTITDSDSTYKGWVLNKQGKLLGRFDWPGARSSRTPEVDPLIIVKNGYLYTRERDIRNGIDRIVKYKIVFEKQ